MYSKYAIDISSFAYSRQQALFRRGSAYLEQGEWETALKDFKKLVDTDPANKAAHDAITKINDLKKAQNEKVRACGINIHDDE